MDILVFAIVVVFFAWLIVYRLYSVKILAACDRIRSKGLRNTVKALLKATYVFSMIIVAVGFIFKVVRLFSGKSDQV